MPHVPCAILISLPNMAWECPHREVEEDAHNWIAYAKPKCLEPNHQPSFIMNMDQLAVYFANQPTTTINVHGACSINVFTLVELAEPG